MSSHQGGAITTNGKQQLFRTSSAAAASSTATQGMKTTATPELSMVMEKAQVLLTSGEFSALNLLLDDYISGAIRVEEFSDELLHMFAGGEKVGAKER